MSEFFKAELKDRFLEYALDRNDYFEVQTLYDEFLRPNYSLDYVQKLVKEIQEYDESLLDVMGGNGSDVLCWLPRQPPRTFWRRGALCIFM